VLVAGIAGFKPSAETANPSARLLRKWVAEGHFTWLISADIVAEYKAVLTRLGVRPHVVGRIINLLREAAEQIHVPRITPGFRRTLGMIPCVRALNMVARISSQL
jgi:hypothetical protein